MVIVDVFLRALGVVPHLSVRFRLFVFIHRLYIACVDQFTIGVREQIVFLLN